MNKVITGVCLPVYLILTVFIFNTAAVAADKVVVVPLGVPDKPVGDATPEDVVKGKTFSSKAAGKGAVGTLELNAEECPAGLESCDEACIDTQNNPDHCGGCNTQCSYPAVCRSGSCLKQTATDCTDHNECLSEFCYSGKCGRIDKYVFITSTTHTSDLGGLAGADAICQNLADTAGLPGTYKAWLSNATESPSSRFVKYDSPYILVDQTIVAHSWTDLTDTTISSPIGINELGSPSGIVSVFTGTYTDGTMPHNITCNGWTSTSSDYSVLEGSSGSDGPLWTAHSSSLCSSTRRSHLYCFQQ